jgi:hypothetical protein
LGDGHATLLARLAAVLLLFAAGAAQAIRIDVVRYEDGVTIIRGQPRPEQQVILDRRYKTKADSAGHFEFRQRYKPRYCMASIVAGEESYYAIVRECLLLDARPQRSNKVKPAASR